MGCRCIGCLDCERVNVLDLTEAVLPRKARGFERLPAERNVPVFVREADGEMAKLYGRLLLAAVQRTDS